MQYWAPIWENRGLILSGSLLTVALTAVTIVTSTALGFVVYLLRNSGIRVVSAVMRVYLEVFRGSPLLIQVLFIYFGAAYLGFVSLSTFAAAAIAVTLYHGALISEIFRAGFESVPTGQREGARSLGLSRFRVTAQVVFPQAMRVVAPPLVGQCIALVKNTSLASTIGYGDLLRQGQGIVESYGNPFEVFAVVAVIYFIICYPLSLISKTLEKRTARS